MKTVYPTLASALARVEALKQVGIWPAYYPVRTGERRGWALSYDPPGTLLELDAHGYLTAGTDTMRDG